MKEMIVWSHGDKSDLMSAPRTLSIQSAQEHGLNVQHYAAHDPFEQTNKAEIRFSDVQSGSLGFSVTLADIVVASTVDWNVRRRSWTST